MLTYPSSQAQRGQRDAEHGSLALRQPSRTGEQELDAAPSTGGGQAPPERRAIYAILGNSSVNAPVISHPLLADRTEP